MLNVTSGGAAINFSQFLSPFLTLQLREHLAKGQRTLAGEGMSQIVRSLLELLQRRSYYSGDLLFSTEILRNVTDTFKRATYIPAPDDVQVSRALSHNPYKRLRSPKRTCNTCKMCWSAEDPFSPFAVAWKGILFSQPCSLFFAYKKAKYSICLCTYGYCTRLERGGKKRSTVAMLMVGGCMLATYSGQHLHTCDII